MSRQMWTDPRAWACWAFGATHALSVLAMPLTVQVDPKAPVVGEVVSVRLSGQLPADHQDIYVYLKVEQLGGAIAWYHDRALHDEIKKPWRANVKGPELPEHGVILQYSVKQPGRYVVGVVSGPVGAQVSLANAHEVVFDVIASGAAVPTSSTPAPAPVLKVLDVSKNILQGESPLFTVSMEGPKQGVFAKLGQGAFVELTTTDEQPLKIYRGKLPATEPGAEVQYVIEARSESGAVRTSLTGSVKVEAATDALIGPNPMPAEVIKGMPLALKFPTGKSPADMWLQFPDPIGKVMLTGATLNRAFADPPGAYAYQLMRKDHLGNVYAIQGASGTLTIKDGVLPLAFVSTDVRVVGAPLETAQLIQPGGSVSFKAKDVFQFQVKTNVAVPMVYVRIIGLNWNKGMNSAYGDKSTWSTQMGGLAKGAHDALLFVSEDIYNASSVMSKPEPISFKILVD
ncbi:hypothetical protein EYS42_08470 [Aquabacterium lacunae]|uniref:Uncharacterized protein n=1 Tax=Aquabacterium lacunae TaxID=2528630 RepID=A0A4Q9GZ46_9BURK|nr:hypothetical protein [Aquabacterium lacunae]TBO31270.1 hypothetical protein EYS42_08470 [Aquabacterium lacunae]